MGVFAEADDFELASGSVLIPPMLPGAPRSDVAVPLAAAHPAAAQGGDGEGGGEGGVVRLRLRRDTASRDTALAQLLRGSLVLSADALASPPPPPSLVRQTSTGEQRRELTVSNILGGIDRLVDALAAPSPAAPAHPQGALAAAGGNGGGGRRQPLLRRQSSTAPPLNIEVVVASLVDPTDAAAARTGQDSASKDGSESAGLEGGRAAKETRCFAALSTAGAQQWARRVRIPAGGGAGSGRLACLRCHCSLSFDAMDTARGRAWAAARRGGVEPHRRPSPHTRFRLQRFAALSD